MTDRFRHRSRTIALAGLLGTAGIAHFARPSLFQPLIPHRVPGSARAWVLASGGAELACAAAVAHPRTRRAGATASAALFVAVFPGNIKMAVDFWRTRKPRWLRALGWARLPLQWPLVALALRVRNGPRE
ncbi:DoxX family protein [Parasphingorhabdus pacifica]